jgi:hypothetical protein
MVLPPLFLEVGVVDFAGFEPFSPGRVNLEPQHLGFQIFKNIIRHSVLLAPRSGVKNQIRFSLIILKVF